MHITSKGRKVAKAVALLDEKGPPDWRERVNLDDLNLTSPAKCVLGQVFEAPGWGYGAGYARGLEALGIELGSQQDWRLDGVFSSNDYREQWRKQIRKGLK